jgi:hypothetical protein
MGEAPEAVAACGFGLFGLNRLEACTLPRKAASDRVLQKAGFSMKAPFAGKPGSRVPFTISECSRVLPEIDRHRLRRRNTRAGERGRAERPSTKESKPVPLWFPFRNCVDGRMFSA